MKVSRNLIALLTLLLVVGLVLAACGGSTTTTTGVPSSDTTAAPGGDTNTTAGGAKITVKIGAAGPYTGDLAQIGTDSLQAIQMAVEDYNASGKAGNITFAVEVGDDGGDPAKAATVAQKFVSDPAVLGVVGTMTSSAVESELPILDPESLAMITMSASRTSLSQGGFKVFHRIAPSDAKQGPTIAQFMVNDLKIKNIYMVDDKSSYGQGLADETEAALKAGGITDIARASIAPTDKDFSSVLSKVKEKNPSILFVSIPSASQAAAIAKQMKSMGFQVQMMGADGVKDTTQLIKNAGGATEGMYCTNFGPPAETVPEAKPFLDKYIAKYGVTSAFTINSYEAANVMMDAVVKAAAGGGQPTRKAVNDALSATNSTGILGFPIAFTPEGDSTAAPIWVVQVKGDTFVPVTGAELAAPFAPAQ